MDKLISNLIKLIISLIIGLFLIIFKIFSSLFKYKPTIKSVKSKKNIVIKENSNNDLTPDTGHIKQSGDGGWILNPKSTFPLIIYGLDEVKVQKLKRLLDNHYSSGTFRNISNSILQLITTPGFYCKEIEDYVNEYKTKYLKKIDNLILSSDKWEHATEEGKEELLDEFRDEALEIIDKQPYCDFLTLFSVTENDVSIVKNITNYYGYDNLSFYLNNNKKINKIYVLKAEDDKKLHYDKLVNCGLAIKNEKIEIHILLQNVKLKEINDSLSTIIQKPFKRKQDSINFILQLTDPYNKLIKLFNSQTYYQLMPIPSELASITCDKILEVYEYFQEIAELIAHTYVMGGWASLHKSQSRGVSNISGWRISPANDGVTFKFCQKMSKKSYSQNQYPIVPLHIGCRCGVFLK